MLVVYSSCTNGRLRSPVGELHLPYLAGLVLSMREPRVMDDRQLQWINQNRGRGRASPPTAGALAKDYLAAATAGGKGWRTRVMALLEEHAGRGLLDYAEPLSVTRGTLTLAVREPAILYHLRLQWEQRLLQLFQSLLPEAGISAIRFTTSRPR